MVFFQVSLVKLQRVGQKRSILDGHRKGFRAKQHVKHLLGFCSISHFFVPQKWAAGQLGGGSEALGTGSGCSLWAKDLRNKTVGSIFPLAESHEFSQIHKNDARCNFFMGSLCDVVFKVLWENCMFPKKSLPGAKLCRVPSKFLC